MAITALLAFWAVALLAIIIPGPDWAFTLDAGSRHAVVPAVSGLVIGYLLLTTVVATGVGVLVASSSAALSALALVGGAYLIWTGSRTFVRPASPVLSPVPGAQVEAPHAKRSTLTRGIGVSGLNPKSLLLFVSLMPQFADPSRAWPVAGQLGVLGLTYVATCLVVYLALGTLAARWLTTRPLLARAVSRTSGAIMTVVGVLLIAERLIA